MIPAPALDEHGTALKAWSVGSTCQTPNRIELIEAAAAEECRCRNSPRIEPRGNDFLRERRSQRDPHERLEQDVPCAGSSRPLFLKEPARGGKRRPECYHGGHRDGGGYCLGNPCCHAVPVQHHHAALAKVRHGSGEATGAVNLCIGIAIGSLLTGVGNRSI